MKTTTKTLPFVLASLLLAGSAHATGWKCLDSRCNNIVDEVGTEFVALPLESQMALYTTTCERFGHLRALHHVGLQTCTFQYQGKDIIWNSETYRFDKPLFDASYLLSIELRDSR